MQHVSQFFLTDVMLKAINVVAVRQIAVKTLRQLIIKATTALSFSGHFILHNPAGYERRLISSRGNDHLLESHRCPFQLGRDLSSRDSMLSCSRR